MAFVEKEMVPPPPRGLDEVQYQSQTRLSPCSKSHRVHHLTVLWADWS